MWNFKICLSNINWKAQFWTRSHDTKCTPIRNTQGKNDIEIKALKWIKMKNHLFLRHITLCSRWMHNKKATSKLIGVCGMKQGSFNKTNKKVANI